MQIELARLILSGIIVLGFGAVILGWMYSPPPAANSNTLTALSTSLGAGYLIVLNWYFGPSAPK